MAEPSILRETKIGQKGYVKEDVMTYIDELNSKIVSLEDEIKKGAPATPVDQQEIIKYRNQIDNLQEKLNASNNALRAAKKEVEDLQKQHDTDLKIIEQLKAGGPGAAAAVAQSNAQTAAALEAAKKEIDRLNAALKDAQAKAAAPQAAPQQNAQQNAQAAAALEAAKKEIDRLNAALRDAQAKAAAHQAAPAPAAAPAQAANDAELAKTKQEISRLTSELGSKAKEIAERDKTIAQITKDKDVAAAQLKNKDAEIAKLNGEITSLNGEITTLKESASDPTAQMGLIFAEAQKTVNMLKTQAKTDADKTIADATEKADAILREANEKAEKTINDANVTAEACINEANDQAKTTVESANKHADKINEMSSTVRNMLLNEIEGVNTKFNDISSVLSRLTGQATDRMSEAQLIIGEARKSLGSAEGVQKAEAPKAEFKASAAPKASLSDIGKEAPAASADAKKGNAYDPFASIGSAGSYESKNHGYNNNKPASAPAPAPAPQPKQNPAPKKSNFGFDMEALLKAAEEEAAKSTEE
ncbi:MAG: hypothetical protein J6B01_09320 [Ruminococcus sp.]|nr:hypothetical protein [Ruminococcus sp.]